MNIGDVVKYSNPSKEEQEFRFILLEHNGDRVTVQLICDERIKPVETLKVEEVELA
jgi:hypothetical protein